MHPERLTFTLHHLVAELDGLADAILRAEFKITHSQFEFLLAVSDTQPVDVTTLAKRLAVSKAAVSKRVTWFVHRHLVSVAHGTGRRVVLTLTPGGAALAHRAAEVLGARLAEVEGALTGVNMDALHGDLASVLDQVRTLRNATDGGE